MNARISRLAGWTFSAAVAGALTMPVPPPAIAQQADGVPMLLENPAVKAALETARTSDTPDHRGSNPVL